MSLPAHQPCPADDPRLPPFLACPTVDELKDVAKSLRRLPVVEPQLPTVWPAVLLLSCAAFH